MIYRVSLLGIFHFPIWGRVLLGDISNFDDFSCCKSFCAINIRNFKITISYLIPIRRRKNVASSSYAHESSQRSDTKEVHLCLMTVNTHIIPSSFLQLSPGRGFRLGLLEIGGLEQNEIFIH